MQVHIFRDKILLTQAIQAMQNGSNVQENVTYTAFDPKQHSEFFQESLLDWAALQGIYQINAENIEIWFTHQLTHDKPSVDINITTLVFINIEEKRVMYIWEKPSIHECFPFYRFLKEDGLLKPETWNAYVRIMIATDEELEESGLHDARN